MADENLSTYEGLGRCTDEFNWLEYTMFALLKAVAPLSWNRLQEKSRYLMASSIIDLLNEHAEANLETREALAGFVARFKKLNTHRNTIVHSLYRMDDRERFTFVRSKKTQRDLFAQFNDVRGLGMERFIGECQSLRSDVIAHLSEN